MLLISIVGGLVVLFNTYTYCLFFVSTLKLINSRKKKKDTFVKGRVLNQSGLAYAEGFEFLRSHELILALPLLLLHRSLDDCTVNDTMYHAT